VVGLDIAAPQEEGQRAAAPNAAEPQAAAARFLPVDLTSEAETAAAVAQLAREGFRFDAVIHHAGIYDLHSLVELPADEVQKIFAVNLFAAMRLNRLILPLLRPRARIILTSSELAPLDPLPFTGIYAITKTAVERYAQSLRMELQLLGCDVVILRPGAVKTQLLDVSTAKLDRFCETTTHYPVNAARFRKIVNSVEAKNVSPEKIAETDARILRARRPRYVYSLNRNPALRLLSALPQHLQAAILRRILAAPKD
jgi:NAD(P)-dependent dehydrogenase (short-subunit alcohol dehydrogenase family)